MSISEFCKFFQEQRKAAISLRTYETFCLEKTFYSYQAKALIKYSLFIASHLPEMDWNKVYVRFGFVFVANSLCCNNCLKIFRYNL